MAAFATERYTEAAHLAVEVHATRYQGFARPRLDLDPHTSRQWMGSRMHTVVDKARTLVSKASD